VTNGNTLSCENYTTLPTLISVLHPPKRRDDQPEAPAPEAAPHETGTIQLGLFD